MTQPAIPAFAETSKEAWHRTRPAKAHIRAKTRATALWVASKTWKPLPAPVVRCFYSHAVFADCRKVFADWVTEMKNRGTFVTTDELLELMKSPVKGNHFHLSFDDAFANVFEVGFDVLSDAQVPATVFVPVDYVEAPHEELARNFHERHSGSPPIRIASWQQIKEADAAGFEIGNHTATHARLSRISHDPELLKKETTDARTALETRLGKSCKSFAWPYGTMKDIDETASTALRAQGYDAVFSAVRGRIRTGETDPYCIPRHQIEFHWPASQIALWSKGYRED